VNDAKNIFHEFFELLFSRSLLRGDSSASTLDDEHCYGACKELSLLRKKRLITDQFSAKTKTI